MQILEDVFEHISVFHYVQSVVKVLEMGSGVEEHGAGEAIRWHTGVRFHPSTRFRRHQPNQHYYYIRTRARQKRTPPLIQFGPFLFLLCWHHRVETISNESLLSVSSRSLSMRRLCLFVVSRESDTTCHSHTDSISYPKAAHTHAPPFTRRTENA